VRFEQRGVVVERRTALNVLGLSDDVSLDEVKHRFRRLAHDLHPDRGGDPRAFHDVHLAYRLLCSELDGTRPEPRPRVARGRPSRQRIVAPPAPSGVDRSVPLAPLSDRDVERLHGDRRCVLDEELLARLLLAQAARGAAPSQFVSRAPGARTNRLAALLDVGMTSDLRLAARPSGVAVELTARGRGARRAVTRLDLTRLTRSGWTRRRGDALTVLATGIAWAEPSDDGARAAIAAVIELLDALAWPLRTWHLGPRGS
jgi:hypothetical protein